MKYYFLFVIFLLSCQEKSSFKEFECINSDNYHVFKPCRELEYTSKLWDSELNLISEEKIRFMITGKPWEFQPELQKEAIIKYDYDHSLIDSIKNKIINTPLKDWDWVKTFKNGVMENSKRIWMPPFKNNQYLFTQVAPFPDVRLPLEIGKKWKGNGQNLRDGWGDWSNTIMRDYYEVISYESITIPYKELDSWHIKSRTEAPFGTSTHNFWFHHELGFVKMIIKNYEGQLLQIELSEVIEN